MGFLNDIITGGAATLIKTVGDSVKQFVTTDKDRAEIDLKVQELVSKHMQNMTTLAQQELDTQMKEMDSARNREIKLNESVSAGWLSKNTSSLLALGTVLLTFGLLAFMMFGNWPKEKENIMFAVLGFLGGAATSVLSYFFGSSVSSAKKDETINMMKKV